MVTAQPSHSDRPVLPRTIGAISDALRGGRRAQFFAELLAAEQGPELDTVLSTWWGRAVLDSAPDRDRLHAGAEAGTLATMTVEAAAELRHRRGAGG